MMKGEFKSCPFCNGEGGIGFSPKEQAIYGCCWRCDARSSPIFYEGKATEKDFEDARELWNERLGNG